MEKINKTSFTEGLITHSYDSNPDFFSKINFFFFSEDKKLVSAYWEAPEGKFTFTYDTFDEVNYILEGELKIKSNSQVDDFKTGDCFILRKGESVEFTVIKRVISILFIYPVNKKAFDDIKNMIIKNRK